MGQWKTAPYHQCGDGQGTVTKPVYSVEFWQAKLQSDSDPRRTWRSVDILLGRGRVPASTAIDVETFNRFFVDKVAKVRSSTSDAPPPVYSSLQSGVSFRQFSPLTIDDVVDAVRRLPDKSSAADPIPTNVLKQIIDPVSYTHLTLPTKRIV